MKCPVCGGDDLVRDTRPVPVKGGAPLTITGDFCPTCGEFILDRVEGDRYMAALKEARQDSPDADQVRGAGRSHSAARMPESGPTRSTATGK